MWRGDADGGDLLDYTVEVNEGEVVLDIIHRLQATQAGDLAVRWNCKAGKCGSCSAEINGRPRLLCMTRMSTFTEDETHHGDARCGRSRSIRDLVTDVSFNYDKAREVPAFRRRRTWRRASTGWRRSTWSARRSSASASSASCARTPATSSGTTRTTSRPSPARASSCGSPSWTCTRWTSARPPERGAGGARPGLLQHHQVLHRGLPRAHQDHRQRADPDEGARRRPQVRSAGVARHTRSRVGAEPTSGGGSTALQRFCARPVLDVAPALLGAVIEHRTARAWSRCGSPRSRRTTGPATRARTPAAGSPRAPR